MQTVERREAHRRAIVTIDFHSLHRNDRHCLPTQRAIARIAHPSSTPMLSDGRAMPVRPARKTFLPTAMGKLLRLVSSKQLSFKARAKTSMC